jgi:hypothetical protein
MSLAAFFRRIGAFLDPRPARWSTVALLTIVLAYADGAVLTIIKGATGSIARIQTPFTSWLIDSTVLIPVFLLGVLLAFRLAHRRIAPELRKPKKVLAAALVIALSGTVVGVAALVASGAYDYSLQSNELQADGPVHADHDVVIPGVPASHQHAACDETCSELHDTLSADVEAVGFGGPLVLVANLVLVGWMVALFGGRLSGEPKRRSAAAGTQATDAAPVEAATVSSASAAQQS